MVFIVCLLLLIIVLGCFGLLLFTYLISGLVWLFWVGVLCVSFGLIDFGFVVWTVRLCVSFGFVCWLFWCCFCCLGLLWVALNLFLGFVVVAIAFCFRFLIGGVWLLGICFLLYLGVLNCYFVWFDMCCLFWFSLGVLLLLIVWLRGYFTCVFCVCLLCLLICLFI